MPANERKLRTVLMINAFFSLTSGTAISLFHAQLATLLGIGNAYILLGVGIGLILFSATVFQVGKSKMLSAKKVKAIITQDWAWVLGSAFIIALQPRELTVLAYWMIGGVALIVADFAIFQNYFLRKAN